MKKINYSIVVLIISLTLILFVKIYPFINMIISSFYESNGFELGKFVGLDNYIRVINDSDFFLLFKNTLLFSLYVPIQLIICLNIANFLYMSKHKNILIKFLILIPLFLSSTIVSVVYGFLFSYDGPINSFFSNIITNFENILWLSKPKFSIPIIIICIIWMNIGWQTYIYLGAMKSINKNIFLAAKIDGANLLKRLFLLYSNIKPTVLFSFVTNILWSFTCLFPFIHVLTKGGPGYDTTTIDYMIYLKGFITNDFGFACALAIIVIIIILIIYFISRKIVYGKDGRYNNEKII